MNLRQCEVFRVLMETCSVTASAERLGVTQPAVSKMLSQLETELGFRAFLREHRRLVPTPEARLLAQEVERAFVSLDYLTRFARDLKAIQQGHLVIGAPAASSTGWLPRLLAEFARAAPGLSVSVQTMDSHKVAHAVAIGHLDLGIVQFGIAIPQVRREVLATVEGVCVMRPDHRLAARRFLRPADLQDEAFISLGAADRYRIKLDALLEAEGVARIMRMDVPLASSACALVMEAGGIALVDSLSAQENSYRGIAVRPLKPGVAEELSLLLPSRRPESLPAQQFAAVLRAHFAPKHAKRRESA